VPYHFARGADLEARARVVHCGSRTAVGDVEVKDPERGASSEEVDAGFRWGIGRFPP
jgi:acyl-coenzyme A thioesterase PaaI-like protein